MEPWSLNRYVNPLEHVTWPCVPFDDESLLGFLTRTADHNAIHDPRLILRDAGFTSHRCYGVTRSNLPADRLSKLLNVDMSWMNRVRHRVVSNNKSKGPQYLDFHGVTISDRHLDYRSRLVAPTDLRAECYHREIWTISTLPFSTSSWEFLLSHCPSCCRPLTWAPAWGIGRCNWPDCLLDLSTVEGETIPQEWRPGLQVCAGLISTDIVERRRTRSQLDASLHQAEYGALFELAWNLGCLDEVDFASPLANPKSVTPEQRCVILVRGGEMLIDWPKGFANSVHSIISNGFESELLEERLRRIRRINNRLSALDLQGPSDVLRDAMSWRARQHSTKSMLDGLGYISRWTLKTEVPIGSRQIERLERAGLLEAYYGQVGHARTLFPAKSIQTLQNIARNYISVPRAARQLGISIDGLLSLVSEGHLKRSEEPIAVCLWGTEQILKSSLDELILSLRQKVHRVGRSTNLVRLRIAMRGYPGPSKPWARLLDDVLENKISLFLINSNEVNLQECAIRTDQCANLRSLPLAASQLKGEGPEWVPERELYERLNCGWKQIRALIGEGLIQTSNRPRGQTFSRSKIDALSQFLAHPVELKAILGMHPRSPINRIVSMLNHAGISPLAAGFYKRSDVLALIPPNPNFGAVDSGPS